MYADEAQNKQTTLYWTGELNTDRVDIEYRCITSPMEGRWPCMVHGWGEGRGRE